MAPIASPEPAVAEPEKKKKRKDKSEKKRAREEDETVDGHRKHKKSKSVIVESAPEVKPDESVSDKKEKKKKKKDKSKDSEPKEEEEPATQAVSAEPVKKSKKKKRHSEAAQEEAASVEATQDTEEQGSKEKKKEKKSKKSSQLAEAEDAETETTKDVGLTPATEPMDLDVKPSKSSKIYQPRDIPAEPQFPFFTQTVSLYEPLYPSGWAEPITSSQSQILRPLQNRYVPSLHGVLLDYRNVSLGEQPGRKGAALDDESPTTVTSRNEYAVGFGWITADVDLFVPSRGAWMEGSVNLQTEGHIGVVCFGKFNASIEASRLLPSWRWVSNDAPDAQGFEETRSVITADEHGVVRQIHSTGFWVDEDGERVTGKIRFRIRNFDVGTSGATSYLSLEGTMLDKATERELVKQEAERARSRKGISRRGSRRRIPDFAMTRFETDKEQPQENIEEPQPEMVKSSAPESEI